MSVVMGGFRLFGYLSRIVACVGECGSLLLDFFSVVCLFIF